LWLLRSAFLFFFSHWNKKEITKENSVFDKPRETAEAVSFGVAAKMLNKTRILPGLVGWCLREWPLSGRGPHLCRTTGSW
jgi:hypothetical protein